MTECGQTELPNPVGLAAMVDRDKRTNGSRSSKQRARHNAQEQAVCSLSGPIGQLLKIIILNRRSTMPERRRCDRCTISALSKQREAAQVNIMIDWCNLRRPLQSTGMT